MISAVCFAHFHGFGAQKGPKMSRLEVSEVSYPLFVLITDGYGVFYYLTTGFEGRFEF